MSSFHVEQLKSDCGWAQYGLVEIYSNQKFIHYLGTREAVLSYLVGVLQPFAQA